MIANYIYLNIIIIIPRLYHGRPFSWSYVVGFREIVCTFGLDMVISVGSRSEEEKVGMDYYIYLHTFSIPSDKLGKSRKMLSIAQKVFHTPLHETMKFTAKFNLVGNVSVSAQTFPISKMYFLICLLFYSFAKFPIYNSAKL